MKHAQTTSIDVYLNDGCGRCNFFATSTCKVRRWPKELETLRQLVLDCGLEETVKWGVPVYTHQGQNIVNVSALNDSCALGFFKGALLKDPKMLLLKQGEHSQSVRLLKLTSVEQIKKLQDTIKSFIKNAIKNEEAGLKVEFEKNPEPMPEELLQKFSEDPKLKKAFYALTPGRQRGYIIFFSQPKNSQTRLNRIEKCTEKIINGIGLNDGYKK